MSPVAELALPGLLRDEDESGALSDLVSVLVSSGDLFYEWDLVGDAVSWIGKTAEVVGITDAGAIGKGSAFLQRIHPEDLPTRMVALSRHIESNEVFDVEYRVRRDDGQFSWVRERAQVVYLWPDEAARKQLLKFFEAWGPTDPRTLEARRRLSSLLFS